MRSDLLRFTRRAIGIGTSCLLVLSTSVWAGPAQEGSGEGEKTTKKAPKKKTAPPAADPAKGTDPDEGGGSKETKSAGEGAGTAASKTAKRPSIDEEYVRANLEKHLSPTKMEWLPDGRVKLTFDFSAKKEEHSDIFTPRVAKEPNSIFRWSLAYEYAGWWGRTIDDTTSSYYGALRVSQDGAAHLNAWFTDDIEAEMWFANGASTSNRQTIALVYSNGNKSIGSNWGTMAASFQGRGIKGGKGTVENASMDTSVRIKLIVRNGVFEAHRDGKLKQSEKYAPKSYASGKIGFIWGGNLAGFIYKLEVTARPDAKKMAELLRKGVKK
jgi:hypothetical protein